MTRTSMGEAVALCGAPSLAFAVFAAFAVDGPRGPDPTRPLRILRESLRAATPGIRTPVACFGLYAPWCGVKTAVVAHVRRASPARVPMARRR